MPILLDLFLSFAKIGLFTFGGGYAAIPLIRDVVLSRGWLDDEAITYMIANNVGILPEFSVNLLTLCLTAGLAVVGVVAYSI